MAQVGIVMGSDSDMPVMAKAADILDQLGVSYEMTIISAHREPDVFFEYAKTAEEKGFYMPVQRVCRPNHEFRGFQGQIEHGTVHTGDEVRTLPSGEKAHVKSILVADHSEESAGEGRPVTLQLDREVDVSRGCVIESGTSLKAYDTFETELLWMDDTELTVGKNFLVKISTFVS